MPSSSSSTPLKLGVVKTSDESKFIERVKDGEKSQTFWILRVSVHYGNGFKPSKKDQGSIKIFKSFLEELFVNHEFDQNVLPLTYKGLMNVNTTLKLPKKVLRYFNGDDAIEYYILFMKYIFKENNLFKGGDRTEALYDAFQVRVNADERNVDVSGAVNLCNNGKLKFIYKVIGTVLPDAIELE
jgi:hypothetical protein